MTYAEKLQNPKWQKKRLQVFERDNFSCVLCGQSHNTLHVHHKSYKKGKEPWEYPLENFQTLCKFCHQIAERWKDYYMEVTRVKQLRGGHHRRACVIYYPEADVIEPDVAVMSFDNEGNMSYETSFSLENFQILTDLFSNHNIPSL